MPCQQAGKLQIINFRLPGGGNSNFQIPHPNSKSPTFIEANVLVI